MRLHWQALPLLGLLALGLVLDWKPTLLIAGVWIAVTAIGLPLRLRQLRRYEREEGR